MPALKLYGRYRVGGASSATGYLEVESDLGWPVFLLAGEERRRSLERTDLSKHEKHRADDQGGWERGNSMRRRITLLLTALMLMLTMSFGGARVALAAKTTTFEKGTCTTKAGNGGGGGSIKEQHHGQCGSNGSDV